MSTSMWRSVLLAFCALFLTQEALTIYLTQNFVVSAGLSVANNAGPMRWVLSVDPEGTAYAAGLRSGDIVDAASMTPAERFRLFSTAFSLNEPIRLPVIRNGHLIDVVVRSHRSVIDWGLWIAIFAGFWAGACAVVLVLRKPEDAAVRWLVLWLLLMRLNLQTNPSNWVTPWARADLINAVAGVAMGIGWAFLASYASSLLARPSGVVRVLIALSYASAAAAISVNAWALLASWFGFADPSWSTFLIETLWSCAFIMPIVCGAIVFSRIRGPAREQLAWTMLSAIIYAAILSVYNFASVWQSLSSSMFALPALVLQIIAPGVLTYAMLNRRLLDIGFALNRAAVFSAVSIVVVGIFVLVEWSFGEWFASATHVESAIASGGLALALGFSIRAIHNRLDIMLDSVFFRKRHEDEQALLAFAHEASYITELDVLVKRTKELIEERAGARDVRVLLFDGQTYGGVGENDRAIVAMRAHHRVLDLHGTSSGVTGEWAYPMTSRGRLVGVISLGPKLSGESYAPDESAAIGRVAHAVGGAVDILARGRERNDALMAAIGELQESVREIARRLDGQSV